MNDLNAQNRSVLDALLNSWERSNKVLVNLLRALPEGGLKAKITESSHSVSEMFMHMYHERMISVSEEAPEFNAQVPDKEWAFESNVDLIAQKLNDSAKLVRDAVKSRVEANKDLELNYAHPIHLIQLLIFHEAYHHGQIKSALKVAGIPISDDLAGPITWDVWRAK